MKNIIPFRSGCGRMLVNLGAGKNGWRTSLLALGALVGLFSPLHATTDTWTGAGSDNNWYNDTANWGGSTPTAGDILTFAGPTRLTPSNNFGAGTNFGGIAFAANAGAFTLSGNAIDLTGNIANNTGVAETETINLGLVLQQATTVTTAGPGNTTISGIISGGIASGTTPGLILIGSNAAGTSGAQTTAATTTSLGGQNTFTGATTMSGGNFSLNYTSSTNLLDSASSLTLGGIAGGATLTVSGSATANQTVASTVIANGTNSINVLPAGAVLNLGTVTGTDGGTLNYVVTSGSVNTGTTTATSNSNGILGGFAVYANLGTTPTVVDWVSSTGSGVNAVALGDYTGYNTGAASTWTSSSNVSMSASQSPSTVITINSLKFTAIGTLTLQSGTNTISTGGILYDLGITGETPGPSTITGGNLTSSAADIYIFTNSTNDILTINSNLTGSNGLAIAPVSSNSSGTVVLGGTNTFGGNVTVTRSILDLNSLTALPSGTSNGTITLNTQPGSSAPAILADTTTGTMTIAASNYLIQGNGNVTDNGGGTLVLSGNHTYTGVTAVNNNSTLSINSIANGGVASAMGASSNAASNLSLGGSSTTGALLYTGSGASTDRLFTVNGTSGAANYIYNNGSGALNFTNTGTITISATTGSTNLGLNGSNTGNNTFAPLIANGTGSNTVQVTKFGLGTWILTGADTYTGPTTVGAGKLLIGTGGSLSSSTAVSVTGGATFGTASTNTSKMNIFSSTSTAALTLNLGSTISTQSDLEFNLFGGSNSDLLNAGTLTLNNVGTGNTILLTLDNPTSATLSGPYNLLSWSGSTNLTVSEVSFAAGDPAGSLSVSNDTLIFTPTAVPEPSPWMLLVVGAGALFVVRRSRFREIS